MAESSTLLHLHQKATTPSKDGSDGGGRSCSAGGDPGWRPDGGDPIDPHIIMIAQVIGIAIATSGKRQADAPLIFKK